MEHNDPFVETSQLNMDAQLSELARQHLLETSKWAKFLAIVGFIMCGFILLGALVAFFAFSALDGLGDTGADSPMGALGVLGSAMGPIVSFTYLIIGAIYLVPTLYMYRFAAKTQAGLASFNTEQLTEGLTNLKSLFKFMGIVTIIFLGLYLVFFAFTFLGGLAGLML